ncbi:Ty1/Copia family ribonuclease HI, partial [Streptococcus pyogenes]
AISWSSKRQTTVALSTTEAEFMALVYATQESIWLKRLQAELVPTAPKIISIYCDNKSAIQLGKHNATSARTKHIMIKSHFI